MNVGPDRKKHLDRTVELIAHEAAKFIKEVAGPEALITVTRALPSLKGDRMTVFVSVFPDAMERSALSFLVRQREAFSEHLKASTRVKPLPRVDFEIDLGEKNRLRMDELSSE